MGSNSDDHPLEHAWQLYLHYPTFTQNAESYASEAYQSLCEFNTVEAFWQYFNYIPKPSDVFTEVSPAAAQMIKKKLDGKNLEAFGLFKKGVKPEWEDPINVQGGHWECRKDFDLSILDQIWSNLVLALIGETLETGEDITGARVVDKSKNKRPEFRLELWTSTKDTAANEKIREKLMTTLKDGVKTDLPDFSWKEHSHILTTATVISASASSSVPTASTVGGKQGGGLAAATATSIRDKVMGALS